MATVADLSFENGTHDAEFDSISQTGGTIDATLAAAQADTGFGFYVTAGSPTTSSMYGQDDLTTLTGTDQRIRFYADWSNVTLGTGLAHSGVHLRSASNACLGVNLTNDSGTYKVKAFNHDGTTTQSTTSYALDKSIPHWFEAHVHRAAAAGGYVRLYMDGELIASVTGLTNTAGDQATRLLVGHFQGTAWTGSASYDEIVVTDDNDTTDAIVIGPYTGSPEGMITHEGGDFAEYTGIQSGTTDLSITSAAGLASTGFGFNHVIDDQTESSYYKEVAFPVDSVFRFRYYFDASTGSLAFASDGQHAWQCGIIFGTSTAHTIIGLNTVSGALKLKLNHANTNYDGTTTITAGEHYVEALVDMAGGTCQVFLDGSETPEFDKSGSGENSAITRLVVGEAPNTGTGITGTVFIDEIVWRPYNVEIGAWTANILDVDFETGAVTEKAGVETTVGAVDMVCNPASALNGTNFGVTLDLDPNSDSYVTFPLPGIAKTTIRARSFFNLDNLTCSDADVMVFPAGFQAAAGNTRLSTYIKKSGDDWIMALQYVDGASGAVGTYSSALAAGEHWVEIESVYHATEGEARWWLDGVLQEELLNIDSADYDPPTKVAFGCYSVSANAGGTAVIDELIVRNSSTPIGTDGAGAGFAAAYEVDLTCSLAADDTTPDVGGTVDVTVTVANGAGATETATGASVTVTLPAGITYSSDDGSGAYVSGTGVWTVPNVAPSGSTSLVITCDVIGDEVAYTVDAVITAVNETDDEATWDADDLVLTPNEFVHLTMAMTAPTNTLVNSDFNVTLTVSNAANYTTATNVVVDIIKPANWTMQSATPAEVTGNTWTLASDIEPGTSEQVVITYRSDTVESVAIEADVTSATQADDVETFNDGAGADWKEKTVNIITPSSASPLRFFT